MSKGRCHTVIIENIYTFHHLKELKVRAGVASSMPFHRVKALNIRNVLLSAISKTMACLVGLYISA